MAAESGGLLAKRRDTCLQFSCKPSSVAYLPSLSCLVASSSNGSLEVLDIHSGCRLRKITFEQEECNGNIEETFLCCAVEESEKLFISKGNIVGCRGVLGEKILLDSILQYDSKEKNTWKIELDIVQAGILLNGLQSCEQMTATPNQFGGPSVQLGDVKNVADELQRQYEKTLRCVKDFTKKSVKWRTVCLEMEKSLLSDAFIWVYSLMSRQSQDPALPIIGDVVRRTILCNPPKKKSDFGRVERMMMLGELERLETFSKWPHKDYEYALPSPMAEAGFYHPAFSSASEDRAICFKCDICLVYWEPSDQPWSEHERHSCSCPFVKGEYTGNVPMSVCAAVCQAQSLKSQEEKVTCIGSQTCEGLVVVGTSKGTVYLMETVPVLKVKSRLKKFRNKRATENGTNDQVVDIKCEELFKDASSSSSLNNETDEQEECSNNVEITIDSQGESSRETLLPDIAEVDEMPNHYLSETNDELENTLPEDSEASDKTFDGSIRTKSKSKWNRHDVEIQALTIFKPYVLGSNGSKDSANFLVIGRKCTIGAVGEAGNKFRQTLSVAVVDSRSMKVIETKKTDDKSLKVDGNMAPPFPDLVNDPLYQNDFESYVAPETGELSVINEYLRAGKQKERNKRSSRSKINESKRKEIKSYELQLPRYVDAKSHKIFHLFATKTSLFVVVKCREAAKGNVTDHDVEVEECSSIDSDTEVIEMPNGEDSSSEGDKKTQSFIFEYRWVLQGDTVIVHEPHVSSRIFLHEDYLHDVIMISNKTLGFKEQRYGVVGEKVCLDSSPAELILAATGFDQKKIEIISTIDLNNLSVIALENVPTTSTIDAIVYCKGISIVACCLDDGKVVLCPLEAQPKESIEEPKREAAPSAAQFLEGPMTDEKLSQLLKLTKFEAINSGVHVFLPMDWVVGSTSLSANAPLQSKRRLFPHVRDIYPISSPSLPKKASNTGDSKAKDKRLRSKGQSVSFKVFVSADTTIGYMDLTVECTSAITKDSNVAVSLYLIESNQSFLDEEEDCRQQELICGPIHLSDHCTIKDNKASLMLTSAKLASLKSSYLALDLEYRSTIKSSGIEQAGAAKVECDNLINEMAIADFVTNVQIVMTQYVPIPPDSHLPSSCRLYLLEDAEIKSKLLKQFLHASYNRRCLGEESEGRKCLEIIVWMWNMMTFSNDSVRDDFLALVNEHMSDLVKVSFLKGDRTLAHRFFQLITSLYSYSKKKDHINFHMKLITALSLLMEDLQNFFSVGALRWFFRLCNAAVVDSPPTDLEFLLTSMLGSLADTVKVHRSSLTNEQILLQSRFDLAGSPLEPVLAEPVCIDLVVGDTCNEKAEQTKENRSVRKRNNSLYLPASDVPGILEVDQLGFTCLMTSEGSKCEKLAASSDPQGKSLKVNVQPQTGHLQESSMPLVSIDFLDNESLLYEEVDNAEPVPPNTEFKAFPSSIFEEDEDNFDLWTPVDNSGEKDRKAKIVRRRGSPIKPSKAHDIENEFITPESMLLVVERMHAAAQHFAVIDFRRPVSLTDILIPPCQSLSSISVYAWQEQQTEKEAFHVVTWKEVGERALVLTDIIPPVRCKYLKIIANGCRKLNSSKVSISLGNFYGRPVDGTYTLAQLKARLQQQYDQVYCRYSLACDRLVHHITEYSIAAMDQMNETLPNSLEPDLIKAYADCAEAQLSLNHVFHSLNFYESQLTTAGTVVAKNRTGPMSLDFTRVLTECFIDSLLLILRSFTMHKDVPVDFELENMNLSLDHFLAFFQSLVLFGSAKIRQHGCMLLQSICETQPWWKELLIRIFRYCFEEKASHGVPKNRLFTLFIKMLQTTSDLNSVLISLIEMLQGVLFPLFETRSGEASLDLEMTDWLLLVLNELLQHLDKGDWLFLTPWSAIVKESSSLETRTQEQIRLYLQEQQKMLSKFHKNLQALATTAKKKYSTMVFKMPEASTSSKELKDLLLLRRHPLFNKRKGDKSIKSPWKVLAEEGSLFEKAQTGSIDKKHVLPSVNALLKLVLVSRAEDDFERLVLACKVATLIVETSSIPVNLAELVQLDDLVSLLRLPSTIGSMNAPWINHAVLSFLRQAINNGKSVPACPDAGVGEESSVDMSDAVHINVECSQSSGSSGESSETLSGQEGEPVEEKLTDIASSIATNLMKAIKETVGDQKDVFKQAVKNTALKFSKPETKHSTYQIVDGFDRGFQMQSNRILFDNYDSINEIVAKGLWQNKIHPEHQRVEGTYDLQSNNAEVHSLISDVFVELAKDSPNFKSLLLVIYQWISIGSVPTDSSNHPSLIIPVEIAQELLLSRDFAAENKYTNCLYEKAMLSFVNQTNSRELGSFFMLQSTQKQPLYQRTNATLLLKIFAESLDAGITSSGERKTDNVSIAVTQPDKKCQVYLKSMILEVLRNRRYDDFSDQEMLQIANNLPIFAVLDEDEVELTFEIMKSLVTWIRDYVEENRAILMLSFSEVNTSPKRMYVVDKGRHWNVSKQDFERNDSQLHEALVLLDKLISSAFSNSVSGSRLLELFYGKDSNMTQDLLAVLLIAGDPPLQPAIKRDFPVSLMPQNDSRVKELHLHADIERVYQLLIKLANNMMDRHRILASILHFVDVNKNGSFLISKALTRLMKSLLQSQSDIELFVDRGGLSAICDRISNNAELLRWSSGGRAGFAISKALYVPEEAEDAKEKTRFDVDGCELKNLAPCGRVFGPPNSPPADILLQSKPTHRRSRFAAWSYQFTDVKKNWLQLTIELPFAILLKQVSIHQHQSFLGNCPAEIHIEVKGCGDVFISHSPNLLTSGLHEIDVYFARGLPAKVKLHHIYVSVSICNVDFDCGILKLLLEASANMDKFLQKAVRIFMKRPLDAEVIKLNNIELFGKSPLSSSNKPSSSEFTKRFYWVELLNHVLEKDLSTVEKLRKLNKSGKSIYNSLLVFSNLSLSGRSAHSETLLSLIVNIFKKSTDEWSRILASDILPNEGKAKSSRSKPAVQKEVGCLLITAVMRALDPESKESCVSSLLQWATRILHKEISADGNEHRCHSAPYLDCIASVVSELDGSENINLSFVENLTEILLVLVAQMELSDCLLKNCSKLLSSLAVFNPRALDAILTRCIFHVTNHKSSGFAKEGKVFLAVISTMSRSEAIAKLIIDSDLPSIVCSLIQEIVVHLSSSTEDNLGSFLCSLHVLLKYLCTALNCYAFKEWLGQLENCSFVHPLLEFMSTAYLDLCLQSKYGNDRAAILGKIHQLQHTTIKLLKRMTSFNGRNQMVFVDVIEKLLSHDVKAERSLINNSFLKRLVLQLILEEEAIVVELRRLNGAVSKCLISHDELQKMGRSSQDFSTVTRRRLSLSDRLSSLFPEVKDAPPCSNEKPKQPSVANEVGSTFQNDDWPEDADWNDHSNMSVLFASANSASAKRQSRLDSTRASKKESINTSYVIEYYHGGISKDSLPHDLSFGQILHILQRNSLPCINGVLTLHVDIKVKAREVPNNLTQIAMLQSDACPTLLHVFAADGGIQLLARHSRSSLSGEFGETISSSIGFLMKFVSLTGFSKMFLKDNQKAEYLLRLMLGEEENRNGEPIASSVLAQDLPLLPFTALQDVFKSASLDTEAGQALRRNAFDRDIIELLVNHLGKLCFQETAKKHSVRKARKAKKKETRPSYWACGTGFGTGSTASTWDVEKVMQEKRKEDEHVICLLHVLSSYIDPLEAVTVHASEDQSHFLPEGLMPCLEQSSLRSVLSNYLRNDSVLDMARHIPLFNALMQVLRALSSKSRLIPLLLPKNLTSPASYASSAGSINQLLLRLKDCADTYINRLKSSKKRKPVDSKQVTQAAKTLKKEPDEADQREDGSPEVASEALSLLVANIQETSDVVQKQIRVYEQKMKEEREHRNELNLDESNAGGDEHSLEEKYMLEMKEHQFGTFEFVADEGEDGKVELLVPFHFAEILRTAVATGDFSYSSRARRLAQEIASLSTSLPLSFSSSVFLRCDENRLDLMKVLITGPDDTPYANGCFEFDVYFPRDYPSSPMMINLQTNGQGSVRFNPNLYNDGKVCLSILNTWHGRPEEKWNPQTSNLLQVLVSIQSLILVPEPYFNEPGYERSRGTPIGQQNSMDYNANIKQAAIKWAMLEQLRNPSPCFKPIVQRHFHLKKAAIIKQCESWISQVKDHPSKKKSVSVHYDAMRKHFAALKGELDKLTSDTLSSSSPPAQSSQPAPPQSSSDSFTAGKDNLVFV